MKNKYLGSVATTQYGNYNSISWLNNKILNYITDIYSPFGFSYQSGNKDIVVENRVINTEYIDKMVNNHTVMIGIINLMEFNNDLDFYDYMTKNLFDVYHYNGKYFDSITLPTLINTTRKGNIGEKTSINAFNSEFYSRGIDTNVQAPTLEEDCDGVDGKFQWNGKTITIQVKPFSSIVSNDGEINAFSTGALSINRKSDGKRISYLMLYKLSIDKTSARVLCVRGKDVTINGNLFIFKESDIFFDKDVPVLR
jgi:hypothetical protein